MKKLLVLLLVLGISSVASAQIVDIVVASRGPTSDTTEPIDPVKDITIGESEWIDLDIIYGDTSAYNLTSLSLDIIIGGAGSGSLALVDLTYAPEWDPGLTVITEVVAGKHYTIETSFNASTTLGIPGPGSGEYVMAIDHILFHCDLNDDADTTITITNNTATPTGGTTAVDWSTVDIVTPTIGGPVVIHQIPEPMTVALLGLGGLFLLRRRR